VTPKESNRLNSLLRIRGVEAPADESEIQDNIGKYGIRDSTSLQPKLTLVIEEYGLASLLFLDLDNFKFVNDEYDHSTGDAVIQETLTLVDRVVGEQGELFHRTGDEMIVLLPHLNLSAARGVANRIRRAVEECEFSKIGKGVVTVTIGLETYPDTCQSWTELERTADQTAMRAKKAGKNRVESSIDQSSRTEEQH
jgi:diguanylate cyclase (GGDEF)-like protein